MMNMEEAKDQATVSATIVKFEVLGNNAHVKFNTKYLFSQSCGVCDEDHEGVHFNREP